MWTEWKSLWKNLPNEVFFHMLSFVDDIDIRRAFKMPIRKLKLTDEYITRLTHCIDEYSQGITIKYIPLTNTLHVLSHIYDDIIDDSLFSHKIIKNINFNENVFGNAYFTNILTNHREVSYKYWHYGGLSMYIERITGAPYILFNFNLQI